jgi:enamidase
VSPERNTRLIKNIGTLITGDLDNPVRQADSIYIADGLIREIGNGLPRPAEVVIDARGLTAMPGLIDSHSHPTFGEFTPAQEAHAWITHYLHGGVAALISAGELHLPGLPVPPDLATALSLALLAKRCYDQLRPSGVKVDAGPSCWSPASRWRGEASRPRRRSAPH